MPSFNSMLLSPRSAATATSTAKPACRRSPRKPKMPNDAPAPNPVDQGRDGQDLADLEASLVAMGYDLDELDRDNPYTANFRLEDA